MDKTTNKAGANRAFDTDGYLASEGKGRKIVRLKAKQSFFSQGAQQTLSSISSQAGQS